MSIKNKAIFDYYHNSLKEIKQEIQDNIDEGKTEHELKLYISNYLKDLLLPTIELIEDIRHTVGDIKSGHNIHGKWRESIQVLLPIVPNTKIEISWDLRCSTWDGYYSRVHWNYKYMELYVDVNGFNDRGDQITLSDKEKINNINSQVIHLKQWIEKHNSIINTKNSWLCNQVNDIFDSRKELDNKADIKKQSFIKKLMSKW